MKKIVVVLVCSLCSFFLGAVFIWRKLDQVIIENKRNSEKHYDMFNLMKLWVSAYQDQKKIEDFLLDKGYHTVAIYGLGFIGETLYKELQSSNINILYGIDKAKTSFYDLRVLKPTDSLPSVDVIIVTAITYYHEVVEELKQKVECPIVSIENILLDI